MYIKLQNISKNFGNKNIIQNLSLNLTSGDRIGVVGRNGEGKSTLFKIIAGLEYKTSGTISISEKDNLIYVPQDTNNIQTLVMKI
ncbi:MAG: ATP-binding cassette domain-containing protein [bacterium]